MDATLELAWDGQEFGAATHPVTAPTVGDHQLSIRQTDKLGRSSTELNLLVRIDDLAPDVSVEISPQPVPGKDGHFWVAAGAQAHLSCLDTGSGIRSQQMTLQTGNDLLNAVHTLTIESGTSLEIKAEAFDGVGNRSEFNYAPISVDDLAPRVQIETFGPSIRVKNALIFSPAAEIKAVVNDAQSGVASVNFFLNGAKTSKPSIQPPQELGAHRVELTATDACGNKSQAEPLMFSTDWHAPTFQIEYPNAQFIDANGIAWHRKKTAIAIIEVMDDLSGISEYAWSRNESNWHAGVSRVSSHRSRLYLRATDRVGNTVTKEQPLGFDRKRPSISVFIDGKAARRDQANELPIGAAIRVELTDEHSGIGDRSYKMHMSKWSTMTDTTCDVAADEEGILRVSKADQRVTLTGEFSPSQGGKERSDQIIFPETGHYMLQIRAKDRVGRIKRAGYFFKVGGPTQ